MKRNADRAAFAAEKCGRHFVAIALATTMMVASAGCYIEAGIRASSHRSYSSTTTPPGSKPGGSNFDPIANGMVPAGAQMVMRGDGELAFTAPVDGRVYLFDEPAQQVHVSGDYRQGESINVKSTATGVNWTANHNTSSGSGGYSGSPGARRIYFLPDHPTTAPSGG